ncbi:MAG: hypothetical protein J3K34DRAFT_270167 [Monoraphidium minutum]|nr:MAG: hypothetical protein J3K34DRAFT_270167 [Monoraphidium minutum]
MRGSLHEVSRQGGAGSKGGSHRQRPGATARSADGRGIDWCVRLAWRSQCGARVRRAAHRSIRRRGASVACGHGMRRGPHAQACHGGPGRRQAGGAISAGGRRPEVSAEVRQQQAASSLPRAPAALADGRPRRGTTAAAVAAISTCSSRRLAALGAPATRRRRRLKPAATHERPASLAPRRPHRAPRPPPPTPLPSRPPAPKQSPPSSRTSTRPAALRRARCL